MDDEPVVYLAEALIMAYGALVNRLCEKQALDRSALHKSLMDYSVLTKDDGYHPDVTNYLEAIADSIEGDARKTTVH